MKVIIDRFEGEYAVCEGEEGEVINLRKDQLPPQAKEGDVLLVEGKLIFLDATETEKRKKEIEKDFFDLFKE
jgi:hypothetical protein